MKRHRRTLRPPHEVAKDLLRAALHELQRLPARTPAVQTPPTHAAEAPPGLGLLKPHQIKLIRMVVARSNDKLENLAHEPAPTAFPNPATTTVSLGTAGQVEVMDATGRAVSMATDARGVLNVAGIAPGAYTYRMVAVGRVGRFVVER